MEVTLSKALKIKNRLVSDITDYQKKIIEYNQVHTGDKVPYDTRELLAYLLESKERLITLKTKIHTTCEPIREKIFKLGELKDTLKFLSDVPTKTGMVKASPYSHETVEMSSCISTIDMEVTRNTLRGEIEDIQDSIDLFNAKTKISIPED